MSRTSQPVAGQTVVWALNDYLQRHPEAGFRVYRHERAFDDEEIVVTDGDRPLAQIRTRGYPTPSKDRLVVRVAKDWPQEIAALLQHADAMLEGKLARAYRETPLRAHNVTKPKAA